MKLFSSFGLVGDVIFENKRWVIGFINQSAFSTVANGDCSVDEIISCCQVSGLTHSNGKLKKIFAARDCRFLPVSKNPFDYNFTPDDLKEIEKAATDASMGDPIGKFWSECKSSIDGDTLDARTVFNAAHVKKGELTYAQSQLNTAGKLDFEWGSAGFTVEAPTGNSSTPNGVCLTNAFEMIYVPLADEAKARAVIERVLERANLPGRISSHYVVIPIIWNEPQATVRVRELDNMTAKKMQQFFRSKRKGSTKMDTIKACLQSWAKSVPFMEEGEEFFIHMNVKQPESPLDVLPVDWVLARGSHLRVLSSEQPTEDTMNMFVEIAEDPVDDYAAALYALFEAQKKGICIVAFSNSNMNLMFDELRTKVAAAVNV